MENQKPVFSSGSYLLIEKEGKNVCVLTSSKEETADVLADAKQKGFKVVKCTLAVSDP